MEIHPVLPLVTHTLFSPTQRSCCMAHLPQLENDRVVGDIGFTLILLFHQFYSLFSFRRNAFLFFSLLFTSSLQNLDGLFVGDLGPNVEDSDLRALFEPYGTITTISIKRDKNTRRSLGYGFVYFEKHEDQQNVLMHKDNFVCNN